MVRLTSVRVMSGEQVLRYSIWKGMGIVLNRGVQTKHEEGKGDMGWGARGNTR